MTSFSRKLFGDSVFWLEDPDCPWVVEMTGEAEEISLLGEFEVDIFITTVKSITKNITKIRITVNVYDKTIVLDYGCFLSLSLNVIKLGNCYVQTSHKKVYLNKTCTCMISGIYDTWGAL